MLMMANVDHIAGEALVYVIERLMAAGAKNVHVVQAMTKKGRWELLFFVDLPEDKVEPVSNYMVRELGTLGLRIFETRHVAFKYQVVQVQLWAHRGEPGAQSGCWPVRVKLIYGHDGELAAAKAEYEDLRLALEALALEGLQVPFADLKNLAERAAKEAMRQSLGDLVAEPQQDP